MRVINRYHEPDVEGVSIQRPSIFGNPFSSQASTVAGTIIVSSREEAISRYEEYFHNSIDLRVELKNLIGKNLICTCKPKDCHGDILLKYVDKLGKREWYRYCEDGYEVSTKGDWRFSAFNAKLDGKSIEWWYQCNTKGYSTIEEGKGKPSQRPRHWNIENGVANNYKVDKVYEEYLSYWERWCMENPLELMDLALKSRFKPLTDLFASSEINQARALTDILNQALI